MNAFQYLGICLMITITIFAFVAFLLRMTVKFDRESMEMDMTDEEL